jgi:type I restriction enzyme M protein
MVNIGKRELLELLEKKTLRKLVDSFELPVRGNASHQTLVDALVAKRSIKPVDDILPEASLSELKAVCTYAELPSSGKKADLLAQLIDTYQSKQNPSVKTTKTKPINPGFSVNNSPSTVKKIVNKAKPNAMFEQTFKNIDDIFYKDAGCSSELDYTEQSSWMLFLKYLDDLEFTKSQEAELMAEEYQYIIDEKHRWSAWAAPKTADGQFDHDNALTGSDLMDYVDGELFPYLKGFKQRAESPNTIEYKIGEIFGEIKNKIQSGYSLRDALEKVDELRFRSQEEKHELSHLYESKIKNMGNAGRNGGEYYTPRPLIRAMIDVLQPQIGETIYDGAAGSAGFLCEAFDYLYYEDEQKANPKSSLSTNDQEVLQTKTFYAKEKKSLAYVIAIMNMILHGIKAPNVTHTNTLGENLQDITPSQQHNIVLANPPFGGKERPEVQQNFPIKTGETAFLFLQHFIKMLKPGGRAAIVIKNTFLSNTDKAAVALRKELLENCNLHSVLDCPGGTFLGAGVKTVVLFFTQGEPTQKTWFYELNVGRNMGKTNPLNDNDLKEFVEYQGSFKESEKSWSVDVSDLGENLDLQLKNPNQKEEAPLRAPMDIISEIIALDKESEQILSRIEGLIE